MAGINDGIVHSIRIVALHDAQELAFHFAVLNIVINIVNVHGNVFQVAFIIKNRHRNSNNIKSQIGNLTLGNSLVSSVNIRKSRVSPVGFIQPFETLSKKSLRRLAVVPPGSITVSTYVAAAVIPVDGLIIYDGSKLVIGFVNKKGSACSADPSCINYIKLWKCFLHLV